jgi:hypothetical protein
MRINALLLIQSHSILLRIVSYYKNALKNALIKENNMQIELDYITEKLHAIDLTLEDVVYRGNTPSGYLTINAYLDDMKFQLGEIQNEIDYLRKV